MNFWRFLSNQNSRRDDEIDEELMFHLRSRLEDNRTAGLSEDAAWEDAQRRLGSLRRAGDECRSLPNSSLAMSALVLLILGGIGFLVWQTFERRREQLLATHQLHATEQTMAELRDQLAKSNDTLNNNAGPVATAPFRGRVTAKGQPVADAKVALVVKTWPGGRYQQAPYVAATDAAGEFILEGAVPAQGRFALLASVAGDGFALASSYAIYEQGAAELGILEISLEPGTPLSFIVRDELGRSVPNALIAPSLRTAKGETHLVYFDASTPLQIMTDREGRASMSLFQRGDQAELYVQIPGRDWQEVRVAIPSQGDEVVVRAGA